MSQRLKLMDASGKVHVAYKTSGQPYETVDPLAEGRQGASSYELEDGRALRYDEVSEQFEIVATGERLKRAPTTSV